MTNPLLEEWETPYGLPPFDRIKVEHYEQAVDRAIEIHNTEMDAITANRDDPDFHNTVEALERSGALLDRILGVFFNLPSSLSDDDLQAAEAVIAPKMAAHSGSFLKNQALFDRVRKVYDRRDGQDLAPDQLQLLQDTYTRFVRAGAALNDTDRAAVQKIEEELAGLETTFGQNVLKDTNGFELVLAVDDKEENVQMYRRHGVESHTLKMPIPASIGVFAQAGLRSVSSKK